jgi:N-acetyl-gamma-glutamyl-phosphate reductase
VKRVEKPIKCHVLRLASKSHPWDVSVVKRAVGVVGGSGYSGQELIDLLRFAKRDFDLRATLTREDLASDAALQSKIQGLDIVFLCTPNEISLELAPKILAAGVSVIDLSGAFRLKKHSYPQWYGFDHSAPADLARSEYALYPWVKPASLQAKPGPRLIANPGCYATAVEMTLVPLLKSEMIDPSRIYVDAKSGTSGAGRKPSVGLLFTEVAGEFKPYKVGSHQHWPEIVETLETLAGVKTAPVFVTELLPLERGISAAFFLEWNEKLPTAHRTAEHLASVVTQAYASDPSVEVGTLESFATLRGVQRNNRISIRTTLAFGRPVVFTTLDNLQRGAAGQALMNAYCLAGLEQPEFLL